MGLDTPMANEGARHWLRIAVFFLIATFPVFGANYYYDTAGRLLKVDYGSAGAVTYTYDNAGNLMTRQVQPPQTIGANAPKISAVANAESGSSTIAPNTWVAIYGTNLGPAGDSRIWAGADFVNNQLPTRLDNVVVTVNGKNAFIYYISPAQVNILTPPDPIQGQVQIQLSNAAGISASFAAQAQPVSAAFFVFSGGPYITAVHADGSLIGPTTLYPGATTPAKPGETVLLFANGFGAVSAAVTSGSLTQSGGLPTPPAVKIGGAAATVAFAGLISPGLYQFNVVVPTTATNGDAAISAAYNGSTTQSGVMITVQK